MATRFFLAWVDEGETTFNPATMCVYEQSLYTIQVDWKEGDAAILQAVLRNPRIGLLNANRKKWIWLSWRDEDDVVHPIFFGRLNGIPDGVFRELVTLVFIAKPLDYFSQRQAIADLMRSDPDYYDPVFISPELRSDPDAIIETFAARWHCSRGEDGLPLTVSASNMIEGEDGVEIFYETDVRGADSVDLRFSGTPVPSISVKMTVTWQQTGAVSSISIPVPLMGSYSESIYSEWPKPGASLGGGWKVADAFCADLNNIHDAKTATAHFNWQNRAKKHSVGDVMSASHSLTDWTGPGIRQILTYHSQAGMVWQANQPIYNQEGRQVNGYWTAMDQWAADHGWEEDDVNVPLHVDSTWLIVPYWVVQPTLSITADAPELGRSESLTFTIVSDIQQVLAYPDAASTSQEKPLVISGCDVGVPIVGEGGTVYEEAAPIGDRGNAFYFPSERGKRSLRYGLLRASAQLLAGARVAEATWACSWERGLDLTGRKSARLYHHNMPGGAVEGKITSYQLKANVETGVKMASLVVGGTIGHDGTVDPPPGDSGEDYIEDGYYVPGYFVDYDAQETSPLGNLGYSLPIPPPASGALFPLTYSEAVLGTRVLGSVATQEASLRGNMPNFYANIPDDIYQKQQAIARAEQAKNTWLSGIATAFEITLKNISGTNFELTYPITTTPLKIKKTVDFEAPSNL